VDATSTQSPARRLVLEISRSSDGRLDGRVRAESTDRWQPFSGLLELLKTLEQLLDIADLAPGPPIGPPP
jgi:hypothetical protein